MNAKYSAKDIAQWFINRAARDVGDNGGEYLTHLKLQKLLYYAQGCYSAMKGSPLFKDKIYAWSHGPVVKAVYGIYSAYHDNAIDVRKEVKLDAETEGILEEVYNVFGQFSAWKLRNMTHEHKPWKDTPQNEEIPLNKITEYFKENIVTE